MTASFTPEPDDSAPDDWADEHVRMLRELAELGMQLARAVAAQALAEAQGGAATEPGRADPGLSFSRVSRAVRLTLALEARIREGVAARAAPQAGGFDYEAAAERVRDKLGRVLVEGSEAEARGLIDDLALGDRDQAETLMAEFRERLEDDEAILRGDTPAGEVIAAICRDLGIKPDWSRWPKREAWVARAARADGVEISSPPPFDGGEPAPDVIRGGAGRSSAPEGASGAAGRPLSQPLDSG